MACIVVTAKEMLTLALVSMCLFALASASQGKIGADYGLNGDNLPPPKEVVKLIRENGIQRVRVIETRPDVTLAFADSGIDLVIGVPNKDVPRIAASLADAVSWVLDNVVPFPRSGISAIIVGNKWLDDSTNNASLLVPAMKEIYTALSEAALFDSFVRGIKVSTSHAFSVLKRPTLPPSKATFKEEVVEVMRPLVDFLLATGSFFMVDVFPYLEYEENFEIPIELVLFQPKQPVEDPNTGLHYTNLFDLQVDAVSAAIESLIESSPCACRSGYANSSADHQWVCAQAILNHNKKSDHHDNKEVHGCTSLPYSKIPNGVQGHGPVAHPFIEVKGRPASLDSASYKSSESTCECDIETVANARTYNQNLIQHVLQAEGTPANPTTPINAYIFELLDMDLNPPSQQYFGFFFPNGTAIYPLNFHPKL